VELRYSLPGPAPQLRVDYLVALRRSEPPTPRCRRVLISLSGGDRRRQRALEAGEHLLHCDYCTAMSQPLMDRRRPLAALWPLIPVLRLIGLVRDRFHSGPTQAAAGVGLPPQWPSWQASGSRP
jgi:hypothetical protein